MQIQKKHVWQPKKNLLMFSTISRISGKKEFWNRFNSICTRSWWILTIKVSETDHTYSFFPPPMCILSQYGLKVDSGSSGPKNSARTTSFSSGHGFRQNWLIYYRWAGQPFIFLVSCTYFFGRDHKSTFAYHDALSPHCDRWKCTLNFLFIPAYFPANGTHLIQRNSRDEPGTSCIVCQRS